MTRPDILELDEHILNIIKEYERLSFPKLCKAISNESPTTLRYRVLKLWYAGRLDRELGKASRRVGAPYIYFLRCEK